MTRKSIYILVTPLGMTADEQRAAIHKVVRPNRHDEEYVDDLTTPYRRKNTPLDGRKAALNQLRRGDTLVVATPGSLGRGREDVRSVLLALARSGNDLIDASTGLTIRWTPDVAGGVEFLDRAVVERKRGAAENARLRKIAICRTNIPQPKKLALPKELAKLRWRDPLGYPSSKEVAEDCKVSVRTMYNLFGPRYQNLADKRKRYA